MVSLLWQVKPIIHKKFCILNIGSLAVFITFGLIMLADKYRYRPAPIASTRRVSRRPGSVAPYIEPTVVEHANPGMFYHCFIR